MSILFNNLLLPLLLTETVELAVAFILGYRDRTSLTAVALVNLMTNPLANYLCLLGLFLGVKSVLSLLLIIEPLIVLGEWMLLLYALHRTPRKLFYLSLIMNLVSFSTGWILFGKGGTGY